MQFSIKPPNAFLWKIGYTEEEIRSRYQRGKIAGDWRICPHGESAQAVSVSEFIDNPTMLKGSDGIQSGDTCSVKNTPQASLFMASIGWLVFSGALVVHFLLLMAQHYDPAGITSSEGITILIATLLKGIEALIIAGAITALLGHGMNKVKPSDNDSA